VVQRLLVARTPSRCSVFRGILWQHVKLRPESEVDAGALRALIQTAYDDMKARLAAE